MNINILRYSLFGIAGGQEVDRNFCQTMSSQIGYVNSIYEITEGSCMSPQFENVFKVFMVCGRSLKFNMTNTPS